jgi:hypothetical protein
MEIGYNGLFFGEVKVYCMLGIGPGISRASFSKVTLALFSWQKVPKKFA